MNLDNENPIQDIRDSKFEVVDNWAKLPPGWSFNEVTAVAVDDNDNVYVLSRSDHPVTVFDRDGNFLRSWGEDIYKKPHGIHFGHDGHLYITDDGLHIAHKCTTEGRIILELGDRDSPQPYMSGRPFHRCTHTALSPNGEIYVSDGYGNARIHKFDPNGKYLFSWGGPGSLPGEFNIPHNICCDADGWVYVADRENHRIQVFDENGKYETQWNNLHRPCALFLSRCSCPKCYVGELGPAMAVNRNVPNIGPRVSILDMNGTMEHRIGGSIAGTETDEFIAPHGIAVDSSGDIYVGEVCRIQWSVIFPDKPIPQDLRALRKLKRIVE